MGSILTSMASPKLLLSYLMHVEAHSLIIISLLLESVCLCPPSDPIEQLALFYVTIHVQDFYRSIWSHQPNEDIISYKIMQPQFVTTFVVCLYSSIKFSLKKFFNAILKKCTSCLLLRPWNASKEFLKIKISEKK